LCEIGNHENNQRCTNDNNRIIDGSSSEEEEVLTKEGDERRNQYDYRVKADIPLFYRSMGMEEFLHCHIDVD